MDNQNLAALPADGALCDLNSGVRGVAIAELTAEGIGQVARCPAIVRLVESTGRQYDPEAFTRIWSTAIQIGLGTAFISVEDQEITGCAGALVAPDPFSGVKTASLAFWVMTPDASMRSSLGLWAAFERWAKKHQAGKMMVATCHEAIADMDGFFIRQGYRPTETRYERLTEWVSLKQ